MSEEARGRLPSGGGFVAELSERTMMRGVYALTVVVCALVALLMALPGTLAIEGVRVSGLPALHAVLNGTTAILLVAALAFIRTGRREAHRRAMLTAFALSALFLVSYVVYHSQAPSTPFGGEGWIRPLYFSILISHILLAPTVLPLALFALLRGLRGEFDRHRRVVRWAFPIWLYVAVTGVLVYLMMAPYYGS